MVVEAEKKKGLKQPIMMKSEKPRAGREAASVPKECDHS